MPPENRPIRIVTDSSADLLPEQAQELDITVVPLVLSFGEEIYRDGELTTDAFWHKVASGLMPKTSQPPPGIMLEAFASLVAAGFDVLFFTVTARHSGTYESAVSVAAQFDDHVTVVDSRFLSMAMGCQVIRAAEMARQRASKAEILDEVTSLQNRICVYILLESLEFLRRGGRAAALLPAVDRLARALSIRPILSVIGGQLKLTGVVRSKTKGIMRLASELASCGLLERAQVMHIQAEDQARRLVSAVAESTRLALGSIATGEAGSVLACHGGKGVLAVIGLRSG